MHIILRKSLSNMEAWSWETVNKDGTRFPLVRLRTNPTEYTKTSVNLFIGPSGAGKSRLMRQLMLSREWFILLDESIAEYLTDLSMIGRTIKAWTQAHNPAGKDHYANSLIEASQTLQQKVTETISRIGNDDQLRASYNDTLKPLRESIRLIDILKFDHQWETIINEAKILVSRRSQLNLRAKLSYRYKCGRRTYLPTVRNSNPQAVNMSKIRTFIFELLRRTNSYTNPELPNHLDLRTGAAIFEHINKLRGMGYSGDGSLEDFISIFETLLFNGNKVRVYPRSSGDQFVSEGTVSMHISDETKEEAARERSLSDYGEGIESLFIMMFWVWFANPGSAVFIEEPEVHLHPHYQSIFFDEFLHHEEIQKKGLRIFFTTHSSHLLSLALERPDTTTVHGFQAAPKPPGGPSPDRFLVRLVSSRDQSLLYDLGVQNASAFLANCSIWVEGVDDRRYLKAYLRAYLDHPEQKDKRKLKEDLHYAFFEYGGTLAKHYLFGEADSSEEKIRASSVSNRIFFVADQDTGKDEGHEERKASQTRFFRYASTVVREVENLQSGQFIVDALRGKYPTARNKWPTTPAGELRIPDQTSYRDRALGEFLEDFTNELMKFTKSDSKERLADRFKRTLSEHARSPGAITWDNMTPEAKDLTRALYEFIAYQNFLEEPETPWWPT